MADWLSTPDDEEEEGTGGVAQALAAPRRMFVGDDEAGLPDATPSPAEKASAATPDVNRDSDIQAHEIANPAPPKPPQAPAPKDSDVNSYLGQSAPGQPQEEDEALPQLPAVPVAPKLPDDQAPRKELAQEIADFNPNAYKPSGWRRAGAAIASALTTFGSRSPEAGMKVGEMALNGPLNRAKAVEQQKEDALRQQIQNTDQQRADAQQDYNNQVSRFNMGVQNVSNAERVRDWQAQEQQRKAAAQKALNTVDKNTLSPVDPNNPFGEWQGRTPGGQVVRGLDPPASVQKDPRYIFQSRMNQVRSMDSDGIKLAPQEKKFFLLNGKLAEPSQHTTISIRENPDGSPVQPKGRAGTPQNISDIVAQATQNKQAFIDSWTRVADQDQANAVGAHVGDYVKGNQVLTPQEMQDRIDKFRTDANVKLNKYGAHLDEQGNLHTEPGQPELTPGTTQAATPQPQQQPQGRALVKFGNGQTLTDPALARQYLAKAGGDKQKARQLAQQDHWKL